MNDARPRAFMASTCSGRPSVEVTSNPEGGESITQAAVPSPYLQDAPESIGSLRYRHRTTI